MSIFAVIKNDFLWARKNKEDVKKALLSVVVSDLTKIGKDDGDREVTDTDVITYVKKSISSIKEVLKLLTDKDAIATTNLELMILEAYIPRQLSESELRAIIKEVKDSGGTDMKAIMAHLRMNYAGLYDGKLASEIAKEV